MKITQLLAAAVAMIGVSFGAQASFANGGFENGFDGWTPTEHAYIVTMNGTNRDRHSYLDYRGWEGADVWFSNNPFEGISYAVFGSEGNESNGSLTSGAMTATNQFLSFSHSGNNTSFLPDFTKAFGSIRNMLGQELLRVYATSYNDSVWRTFNLDLTLAGLNYGDQFTFYYEDGYSWSVIDGVSQTGAALQAPAAPVSGPLALSLLAFAGLLVSRKRQ